jgi:hypothetical protein
MRCWRRRAWGLASALGVVLAPILASPVSGQDAKPSGKQPSRPAVEKDMAYAEGSDQQQLDLYLPQKKGFTTIVFTYGGG